MSDRDGGLCRRPSPEPPTAIARSRCRLIPAKYVGPYSKGQKNDFSDAEAIAEAVQRPTMKSVATKKPSNSVCKLCTGCVSGWSASAPASSIRSVRYRSVPLRLKLIVGVHRVRRCPVALCPSLARHRCDYANGISNIVFRQQGGKRRLDISPRPVDPAKEFLFSHPARDRSQVHPDTFGPGNCAPHFSRALRITARAGFGVIPTPRSSTYPLARIGRAAYNRRDTFCARHLD